MKKVGLIIFFVALTLGVIVSSFFSFGKLSLNLPKLVFGSKIKGSGNVITQKRNVADFKSVKVGGVFLVEITAQKEFSVQIEADDNLLPLITTRVSGGTLRLETEKRFSTRHRIKVRISAPDIEELDVSGASRVSLSNMDNDSLTIDASGASRVTVTGKTDRLNLDTSGASRIDAGSLDARKVAVDGSGASRVTVNAAEELTCDLSGASHVNYSGSPKQINKKTSGASSVRQH